MMPRIRTTRHKLPILIGRPHASYHVPPEIRRLMNLSDREIKNYCDLFTDEIFDVPQAYMVTGGISRLVTDLNRAPDHIMTQAEMTHEGVVTSVTFHGKPIWKYLPKVKTIKRWIRLYHHPFHRRIKQLLPRVRFFIDGHSMYPVGPELKGDAGKRRPDIVLGNREYSTCSLATTNFFKRFFEQRGYRVKVNDPYMGKYIMGAYCSRHRLPGIQIEVNEALYLNPKTLQPRKRDLIQINQDINDLAEELVRGHLKIRG